MEVGDAENEKMSEVRDAISSLAHWRDYSGVFERAAACLRINPPSIWSREFLVDSLVPIFEKDRWKGSKLKLLAEAIACLIRDIEMRALEVPLNTSCLEKLQHCVRRLYDLVIDVHISKLARLGTTTSGIRNGILWICTFLMNAMKAEITLTSPYAKLAKTQFDRLFSSFILRAFRVAEIRINRGNISDMNFIHSTFRTTFSALDALGDDANWVAAKWIGFAMNELDRNEKVAEIAIETISLELQLELRGLQKPMILKSPLIVDCLLTIVTQRPGDDTFTKRKENMNRCALALFSGNSYVCSELLIDCGLGSVFVLFVEWQIHHLKEMRDDCEPGADQIVMNKMARAFIRRLDSANRERLLLNEVAAFKRCIEKRNSFVPPSPMFYCLIDNDESF